MTEKTTVETVEERRAMMSLLAKATRSELSSVWSEWAGKPEVENLRGPETGLVMVRGRMGGGGAPFNLGETTVTRATVRLASGTIGHAYALGRDREKVRLAAVFEALWQEAESRPIVIEKVLEPVARRIEAEDGRKRAETAATKVDFFTMVRGDD